MPECAFSVRPIRRAFQHSLYRAMKASSQIIKSLFILRYVNEVELRQAIE